MNLFPARLRCPSCGGVQLRRVRAGPGRVDEETALRRGEVGVRIGSVRLAAGPVVIARLAEGAVAGAVVRLDVARDGAVLARHTQDQRSN
jgi:hypothetical protein